MFLATDRRSRYRLRTTRGHHRGERCPIAVNGLGFLRGLPNVTGKGRSERHSPNPTTHGLGITFEHERTHHAIQQPLEQRGAEEFPDPNKTVTAFLLVLHPSLAHALEGAVADPVHEPPIGDAGANVGHQMTAYITLVIAFTKDVAGSKHTRPDRHSHAETPHEVLKAPGFANVVPAVLFVPSIDGEVAFSTDPFDGGAIQVWIVAFVPGDGFVQETFALALLSPQTRADEADTVDDDQVGVRPRCEFIVELESDVIGMVGGENFAVSNGRCTLRSAGDDGTVLFLHPRLVMNLNTRFFRLAFEALVNGVGGRTSLHDPVSSALCAGLGDGVIGMDEVNGAEFGRFERRSVQAPSAKLVKEVVVHAPIFEGLKITVKSGT